MDDIGRYQYVSSFYGPGTICCWLLAFLAVILSWTLNPDLRDRDIIADENFIPMLAIPSVAAIHGMYQLLRFPGGPKTLLTGLDTETLKYSSAFEASVTVCIGIFLGILFVHLPFLNELVQPNIIIAELKSLAAIRPGDIFPKTNASLQDLDQLVPFGIGFILFALSIRKNLQARAQQQAALNLIELEQAL
ncbi:hypothetical protein DM02DRAFT_726118 [Periconia macrospinosa]|uniref:Uncharacterized protein n=1 Tax=Periconia macrospinosa TaxID=97972 RepID=A0A2V1E1L9_9PLEO|nr:hypothetical protein DM02DRAFT_726118 [Periconia macrospinosa]